LTKEELRAVNSRFNERLRDIIKRDHVNNGLPLYLGMPSECLISCGIPDLPIEMSAQRLIDKKLQSNHPFNTLSVVHMPDYLSNPIAVFISKTTIGSKVILTEMQDNGVNLIVALQMNKQKRDYNINDIRSVYLKSNFTEILRWIAEDNLMEWANKQKALDWVGKQQYISAEVTQLIKDSTNVIKNNY